MKIILKAILLTSILSGCATINVERTDTNKKHYSDFLVEKTLKNDIVTVSINSREEKKCSIFLNKRLIELDKVVIKNFTKKVKLKENESKDDIVVSCN